MALPQQVAEESVDDPDPVSPEPPKKSLDENFDEYEEQRMELSEKALTSKKGTVLTNIKRAMTLYESSGDRGKILEKLYSSLLSIPATSVEVMCNQIF